MAIFLPECRPLLIGSLPLTDHQEATEQIFAATPEIPLWPQLPVYPREGMLRQFVSGMPGLMERGGKIFVDPTTENFAEEILGFYEEYLLVTEGGGALEESRFILHHEDAPGFSSFLRHATPRRDSLYALKGQSTGPVTFATSLADNEGRAIFYNDQLRDAAVKLLALKARWQARMMGEILPRPIVFFDEPGLAGLGSSAFITVTPEIISTCLDEVFSGVREEGGLTGIHVCANTEWPVLFASGVDIVSFDAYGFFDKLILYPEELSTFLARGGVLASGIVPTAEEFIDRETADTLVDIWFDQCRQLENLGIAAETVYAQSLITPSCGTGTISRTYADRVLELTREVSGKIRRSWR